MYGEKMFILDLIYGYITLHDCLMRLLWACKTTQLMTRKETERKIGLGVTISFGRM